MCDADELQEQHTPVLRELLVLGKLGFEIRNWIQIKFRKLGNIKLR